MAEQPEKSGLYTNVDRKTTTTGPANTSHAPARKRGVPWWAWLIAALVILALLWWLFSGNDQEAVVVEPTGTTVEPVTPVPPPQQ
ncbi:hypothetical protein [Arenibaculum sp.]|uniref:hypothetical protein n=1 Tax=Arenibaculum sp. TaxID=2865862 RepID=UPI002E0EEB40|nr:hypothetical protein [Arenibaculum sp.]